VRRISVRAEAPRLASVVIAKLFEDLATRPSPLQKNRCCDA